LYIEFSRKEQKISKIQELRADKFASEACGDSKIFINAVCKLYVYDLVWQNIEKDYYEMVRNKVKNKIKNLSLDFIRTIRNKIDKSKLEVYLKEIYKNEQKHPSDTHPTIEQRMKNLKVNKKDINNKSLTNFLPSAASLIDNIDIEPNITILDPCVSKFDIDGSFYKYFPEITINKYCGYNGADNFLNFNERVDYIISHNVPSMIVGEQLWNVILKSISIINK
jgi:hypothetical protein